MTRNDGSSGEAMADHEKLNGERLENSKATKGEILKMKYIKSGTRCYDWTIPKEWIFNRAYIINKNGEIIIDAKNNNLHTVGYSEPIDRWVKRKELERHLYYIKEMRRNPICNGYYKRIGDSV